MEEKEILDGNKLMAEFTGWILKEHPEGDYYARNGQGFTLEQFCPNLNWNFLIDIVGKIESIGYNVNILRTTCDIYDDKFRNTGSGHHNKITAASKLEAVWQACIDFIKWYNTQPQ
jgi:hypothetical protein